MNAICGAKKRDGTPCQKPPMIGATRCRLHGGATPRGLASPNFKTGRFSKYLPESLLSAYDDVVNDPELLSVRHDIHLLDTLIAAKLNKLDDNESAATWKRVDDLIRAVRKAYKSERYGDLEDALDEMEGIADQKRLFYATEQEVTAQLEQRRKLVETENKTLYNKERALTAEQAMLLMSAVLDSVRRNVTNADALTAIQADFIRFASIGNQQRIDSGE
jgi:hypothetical protein